MKTIDPAPPRSPIAPEDESSSGDVPTELEGVPAAASLAPLFNLGPPPAERTRPNAAGLARARDSDADEVLSSARNHVVAGD